MTYILIGISIFLLFVSVAIAAILRMQFDKNKDLQLENSDLIDRNLKLQGNVSKANKEWININSRLNNALDIIQKKKELLEIQDRLLEENNIKH